MGFENRHLFNGKINNQNVYEVKQALDYKVRDLEGRRKIVDDVLSNTDENGLNFFENYFDGHYKCELNQNDSLSENNNVCKALEQMADYLLGSEEVRDDRKEKKQGYRFFIDRNEYNRAMRREESMEHKCELAKAKTGISGSEDTVINFLIQNKNFKKPKRQVITKEDLMEDSFCGEVLRAYKEYDNELSEKLKSPQGKGYKLREIKGEINQDMIYTKDTLKGVFGYKLRNALMESTCPSWEMFDWTNQQHVKALIYVQNEFTPDDDLSLLLFDLEALVEEMVSENVFSGREYAVYKMIRSGYKNIEIAKELELTRTRISNLTTTITNKIIKQAEKMGY